MEWEAPAIVLDARRYGEADAIVALLTEEHGPHRGLVRAGLSRSKAAIWQPGNFVQVRWTARLSEQLGNLQGELIHAVAAPLMDETLGLAMLCSACALAEGALPEREPHPRIFEGLLRLLARLSADPAMLGELVAWEVLVLSELGYGMDLGACAVTGARGGLAYVSPRTGRAVTEAAAGEWTGRLLRLPGFLVGGNSDGMGDWRDGLRLTGHFLARDVFGVQHKPLPQARLMLYDRVAALAAEAAASGDQAGDCAGAIVGDLAADPPREVPGKPLGTAPAKPKRVPRGPGPGEGAGERALETSGGAGRERSRGNRHPSAGSGIGATTRAGARPNRLERKEGAPPGTPDEATTNAMNDAEENNAG